MCHCVHARRAGEAISSVNGVDCFAALAMTVLLFFKKRIVIASPDVLYQGEAISSVNKRDCFVVPSGLPRNDITVFTFLKNIVVARHKKCNSGIRTQETRLH